MNRRQLLRAAIGAGLSAVRVVAVHGGAPMRVGIIGGGIVGAAIAMRCAQAGAAVTLMEKAGPAAGATGKSFAWINPFVDDPHYMAMRLQALTRWHEIDRALGMRIVWGGYLEFTDRPADRGRLDVLSAHLREAGHPMRSLDLAGMKRISPAIDPGALLEVNWSDLGGHVDPVHATRRLMAAAERAGARILYPCQVVEIEPQAVGVEVITSRGRMRFDHLVMASGVDAPAMLAPLGYRLPLLHKPGALMHSKPMHLVTRLVYDGPGEMEWKQAADGSLVGTDAPNPPDIPAHQEIRQHAMEFPPGIAELHGRRILSKLAIHMPSLKHAEVGYVTLGFRPYPVDGYPVVGPVPGAPSVTVCVMHSGVTLAPLIGDYMVSELLAGLTEPMLLPYRPTRTMT